MIKELFVLFFATAAGLTLSGISANLYRIVARKPKSQPENALYYAVMIVAGPSVLIENATKSFRGKACSGMAYGFAAAITGYWSFVLGLLMLTVWLKLK